MKNPIISSIETFLHPEDKTLASVMYRNYVQTARVRESLVYLLASQIESKAGLKTAVEDVKWLAAAKMAMSHGGTVNMAQEAIRLYKRDVDKHLRSDVPVPLAEWDIQYYADAWKTVVYAPERVVLKTALECIVDGRKAGMTGSEYFDKTFGAYTFDSGATAIFNEVFSMEEEMVNRTYFDLVSESLERFFINDWSVRDKINRTKHLDAEAFKKSLKEGDVLIVMRKAAPTHYLFTKLTGYINQMVTGSSFTSTKVVGRNAKTVIGYGAKQGLLRLREVELDYFMETCYAIVTIRHHKMNPKACREILAYLANLLKIDPDYDYKTYVTSPINHERPGQRVLTQDEAKVKANAMICTTVVTAAYRAAGIDPMISVSDDRVWPIDFLKSPAFDTVSMWMDPTLKS